MFAKKNQAINVVFAPVDSAARPTKKSGVAFNTAGCVQYSQNGGAWTDVAAVAGGTILELGSTGRYVLPLTAAEMNANTVAIKVVKVGVDDVDWTYETFSGVVDSVAGNVVGSVGSVTGSVGSVAGSVGGSVMGNVVGSVGSVASGGIAAASLAAGALSAIAAALRDVALGSAAANSLGAGVRLLVGVLGKKNFMMDSVVRNSTTGFMTSARIRVFPDSSTTTAATDGGSGEGDTDAVTIVSTPEGSFPTLPKTMKGTG